MQKHERNTPRAFTVAIVLILQTSFLNELSEIVGLCFQLTNQAFISLCSGRIQTALQVFPQIFTVNLGSLSDQLLAISVHIGHFLTLFCVSPSFPRVAQKEKP